METPSTETISHIPNNKHLFWPQDVCNHPCDVTLVVEDEKKFQAHRNVLAKASQFFDKLLSCDMRESKDGVVRLEMLNEFVLRDILEFIYTGEVQISDGDRAQDLIAVADYMFLPQLKSLAGISLTQNLNFSNCLPIYHFAQTYRCKEAISGVKTFVFANFNAVSTKEEFLNMPINDIEMWISSDELNVSAEEDVFELILTWIDRNKVERKKYFSELFRHVRLVHVNRDYLCSNIAKNKLVSCNDSCVGLVKDALRFIESNNHRSQNVRPRKSLETPVILIFEPGRKENTLCYLPREDTWCKAPRAIPQLQYRTFSCEDKLYLTAECFFGGDLNLLCYDSLSDSLTSLTSIFTSLKLSKGVDPACHIFVTGENEMYALVAERRGTTQIRTYSSITKYIPKLNRWEDVSSFDWDSRRGICIINKDNFVYFLGGKWRFSCLRDAYRYDLTANKWEKIAEMKVERSEAQGAVAHGKVFVIGGIGTPSDDKLCEVYNETTDEWQLIASLKIPDGFSEGCVAGLMCVDDKLHAVVQYSVESCSSRNCRSRHEVTVRDPIITVECYDPNQNQWKRKTELPNRRIVSVAGACSMRVFKGSQFLRKVSSPLKCSGLSIPGNHLDQETPIGSKVKHFCLIT